MLSIIKWKQYKLHIDVELCSDVMIYISHRLTVFYVAIHSTEYMTNKKERKKHESAPI